MAENVIDVKELWKVYSKKDIDLNVEDEEMVESLDKSSDSVVAVRDVTFSVKPGEVFIVMGLGQRKINADTLSS